MANTLDVKDLSVRFTGPDGSEVQALGGVSFSMSDGQFWVALGASGCGKTTMLNSIAGFLRPSFGEVSLNGKPIQGPGADRGVVFQKHALFPWLNVAENVEFALRMRGVAKKERRERALETLSLVGLQDFAGHPVYQLSGGMQQRVGVARALASDPDVLLMDEPLGALDAFTRESMQELLLKIWDKTRKMVFFITHSVEEAVFLGSHLLVFSPRPGRIVHRAELDFCRRFLDQGDARAVKSHPDFIRVREDVLRAVHVSHA
jgi:taurine transport system ATP-binding protein